jgi:hypothetical protein
MVHAKFGEGFFFLRMTRILRGKAGKYAWGIILEKSKKNRRRIVEIFGECRPRCMSGVPGAAFTKCFHNSSTIIPSTILPQANPDAPNSSKQGRIVEELWKN